MPGKPTPEYMAIHEGARVIYECLCQPDDPNWDDLGVEDKVEYVCIFRTALAMFMRAHGGPKQG